MCKVTFILALAFIGLMCGFTSSYRILGIFHHGARSHFNAFEPLMEGLAKRGHEVVVVSSFPRQTPLKHYTDISLVGSVPVLTNEVPLDQGYVGEGHVGAVLWMIFQLGTESCEKVLALPQVLKLTESKFDLVIYELFNTDCYLALINKFDAPYIAMSSSVLMPWHNERFGNPDNPSYIPVHFLPHTNTMNYIERFKNVIYYESIKWANYYFNYKPAVEVAKKHLGDKVPCLASIAKNTSLLLTNTHFTMNLPRPLVPGIIEVGGIHIKPPPKLPKDIETFLNEARHGAIYFSFGSTVRASTFPTEKRRALLEVFAQLPQRVLWKWEGELPGKSDNVMVNKWMPQPGILNHPNLRVFITHGGLMGTTEAVAAGVPMIAVPLLGDQPLNVAALVANGVAVRLNFMDINKDNLLKSLKTLLGDPRYAENAKRLASAFNDRPLSPLDTAIYWSEYTIKHKGAPLIRSAAIELQWYQYYLLDILAPILAIVLLIIMLTYYMIKKFVMTVLGLICKIFDCGNKTGVVKKSVPKVNVNKKKV